MNIIVKIEFNEKENKWHMMLPDGTFIQEFYPCENFRRMFDEPDKEKPVLYKLKIERLNQ